MQIFVELYDKRTG